MNQKANIFQTILLVVFGFALVIAVLIFAGILPGFRQQKIGVDRSVVLWGSIPANNLERFLNDFNKKYETNFQLIYVEKNKETMIDELIRGLAVGRGPDLVFFSSSDIVRYRDLVYPIPSTVLSARDFNDTFVDGASIFRLSDTYLALPIWVDPLVLYYNKNIFTSFGIATPPKTWTDFLLTSSRLTQVDDRNTVLRSGAALGDFNNVTNAKAILLGLWFQVGERLIGLDQFGAYQVMLGQSESSEEVGSQAVAAAFDFFTRFSNSSKSEYAWNRSLPQDLIAFTNGFLSTYFGLASEKDEILRINPNLNLDATIFPQRSDVNKVTYGDFMGIAVTQGSQKKNTALEVLFTLVRSENASVLVDVVGLVPARRDLITQGTTDPIDSVFYQSALIARNWLDPDPIATKNLLAESVQSAILGSNSSSVIGRLRLQLTNILR